MSKDKVYLYDLGSMVFTHRLNLDYHLGRVVLAPNATTDRPLLFYSNSADVGSLKIFNILEKKIIRTVLCHKTTILHLNCDLDGAYVVTCSSKGDTLRVWSVETGAKVASFVIQGSD